MSAYITFYIRSHSGGPFIELESFSRSSYIYQHLNVPYGTTRLLKMDDLREAIDDMAAEVNDAKRQLIEDQQKLQFLQGTKGLNYNELMDHYSSIKTDIQSSREDIYDLRRSMEHLRAYVGILETQEFLNAADLFAAHECDPNDSKISG